MSHKHDLHSTKRQTDEERALSGTEVFASGEGMFFDDANQSVNSRYQRGLNGGLNSANSYDDTGAASMDADASGMYFTEGNRQPDRDSFADTFADSGSVVAPNNLLFNGVIAQDEEELLSARVLGIENAPIIIEEYASMSCGHCASFHIQTLPEIKKKYIDTGRAKLLFRDFPLDRTAMLGSMVTQCMNEKSAPLWFKKLYKSSICEIDNPPVEQISNPWVPHTTE